VRLQLYSSRRGNAAPHLVAIQSEELDMLATVLVRPLRSDVPLTRVRARVKVAGESFVVMRELARPIHRRVMPRVGGLTEHVSALILTMFGLLLARP